MPQFALQSAEASAASTASRSNSITTPVEATSSSDQNLLSRARSPYEVPVDDSPTVGRIIRPSPSVPSLGPLSLSSPRSPRPAISSPLATSANFPYGQASPSPRTAAFPTRFTPTPTHRANQELENKSSLVKQTSFYSDSSDEGSPEPHSPRQGYAGSTNVLRTVSEPITSKPVPGFDSAKKPAMAGPVSAAQAEASKGVARNSSIDSAISAISSKSGTTGSQDGPHGPSEIAHLIKTAGSPETLIQYLLKEKHSQSQQNSQLWRLVDKQRAMILGLNKDLERALKDKEKYRKKLKEVISLSSASVSPQENTQEAIEVPVPSLPRVDIERAKEQTTPESPVLEAESPRNSPIDITMAPYPITPPADQLSAPHSAVGELLNPAHAMPKPQDHALDKYDHEAEERAAEEARKEKVDEPLKEIPYNVAIPPSRSLPSEPPKMPPPKPPVNHLPTVAVLEATPQPDEGLSKFPVPPPRKPPPAPLKLKQEMRTQLSPSPEDGETESDFDDILEVDEIVHDRRGRRRTREEDDRDREIIAFKEAAARSASKKSKSSKSSQPGSPIQVPQAPAPELATASLGEMLSATKTREIPAPLLSPGLPASPRPSNFSSPPLSPRSMNFQAAPLSPRPPRQPIPLPPNTPLATPAPTPARAAGKSIVSEDTSVSQKSRTGQQEPISHPDQPSIRMSSPSERTEVFKGLVTEEYPDLLLPPNALPSIKIAVASSRMKPSRASMMSLTQLEEDPVFTLAIISRSDNGELWRVEKDLASLTKLDQRLKQCTSYTVRAPERSLFSGHAPAKLDARRTVLEQFMDDILDIPFDTKTAVELCKYLSTHVLPPNLDDSVSIGDSSSEMNGNKIGPDGRPCRSGYLTKKGKNFGGWKARYFVLNGPLLKYFEVPGGAHLGTIKLQGAQIGKQNQNNDNQSPVHVANGDDLDNQFRHAFLILEPKKKDTSSHFRHVLCAESDKERDLWVDALLQWVDYRDPEDSEPPPSRGGPVQDRQTQGTATGTERPLAGKVRKPPGKPYHHPSDSDTLVGVRYDSTQAGDAPQVSGPARPKTSGGMPDQHHSHGFETFSSSQSKIISGPKGPQPISDLGAWGNKPNYGPTPDEKKQRKRSFFGFGPKTRSSSEGQDSLFGGSEVGVNATPPQNSYQGPVRQAFGASLAEAVRFCSPTDVNVPLPAVVYRCIQYLDSKNAVLEEGIFRLSGSNVVIKQLRERFNVEGDINLLTDRQYYDIHAVASLLKLYLRELPTTILTRDLHMEFLTTMEIVDHAEKMTALGELVHRLPQANATLLKYLIGFLIKIINNADMNKMTVRNVGIVFSPTLNIPAPVFAMFLQNYEGIFGVDPEVYELPSPVSEPELQRFEAPPRFDLPARPSTSGSSSPHGQMRKDNVRELQRSTPTPPLLVNNAPVRASPPSSATRPGYESPAGAYDIGYRPPSANEGRGAYDRRFLQASHEDLASASAAYDQSFVPSNRRRESAIFMGGMMGPHHQGSKSRLREETRF